jgi:hypothetical protein
VPRRGAVEHYYKATSKAFLTDRDWMQLPDSVKPGLSAEFVELTFGDAVRAIEEGTFDARDDRHISRTPMVLDEQGCRDVLAILEHALDEVVRAQKKASTRLAKSGEEGISFAVGMLGFELPEPPSQRKQKSKGRAKAKAREPPTRIYPSAAGLGGVRKFGRLYVVRRGPARAALLLAAVLVVTLSACGKSGQGAETDPEKGADAELLNAALGQELTSLAAYTRALPAVGNAQRPLVRRFRGHHQEYVDAITKAIRGLGGETEAEAVEPEPSQARSPAELLTSLYDQENTALTTYREAAPQLNTAAPRTLAATLAAGHAQHLVVLRQLLGASLAEAAPEAFESGEEPAPQQDGGASGAKRRGGR